MVQQTNYYKQFMISTIKLLSQIEQDFKKSKPLEGYLPSLITSLESQRKVVFTNMNNKQKLSQLQSLIQAEITKIDQTLTNCNINLQQIDDDQQQLSEEHLQSDQSGDEEIEDEFEGDGQYEQQGNKQGMQLQEEQFPEPQFQNQPQDEQNYEPHPMQAQDYAQQPLQDQDQEQNQQQQQQLQSQDDVGLYGQELNQNDEDFEGYQNEFDQEEFKQFEQQFGEKQHKPKKDKRKKLPQEQSQNPDEHIEDNFDHFRQVEIQNQKLQTEQKPKTDLQNQIDRLQGKVAGKRDWVMKGQVKARQRPANSLLQYDLQFNSGVKYSHQITEQKNTELEELIKKRILNDMFDDRTRFVNTSHIREHFGSLKEVSRQKSQMGLGQLYESQFKNFLGIGQNKNDKLKAEIMDSFKEVNYFLDSLSNFSFVPKPTKDNTRKGQSQAIIVEEKVPLTLWNGQRQVQKDGKMTFESQKQVDNQAKRLKNKRIARQRKKEQIKKKMNKIIQYGGMTKFEAQAKKKAQMNNKPLKIDGVNMKYNKSSSFFKNISENKGGKPNPDVSKMKI